MKKTRTNTNKDNCDKDNCDEDNCDKDSCEYVNALVDFKCRRVYSIFFLIILFHFYLILLPLSMLLLSQLTKSVFKTFGNNTMGYTYNKLQEFVYVLLLIEDEGAKFPLAIPSVTKGRYVDDIFGGADSIPQAQEIVKQLNQLCTAGGFPLKKWISNHTSVLESAPPENQINLPPVQFENSIVHVLGLSWNPSTDTFQFSVVASAPNILTKRIVLSTIARLFDPLGLLAPVIITAKIFIQELWSLKLGWDDSLPSLVSKKWIGFIEQLQEIPKLVSSLDRAQIW